MKKKEKRAEKIAEALDLPLDILCDIPRSELMGNSQLNIENIRGVLDYTENSIKINTTVGIIKIEGDELFIDNISDENIFIKGRIVRMEFM